MNLCTRLSDNTTVQYVQWNGKDPDAIRELFKPTNTPDREVVVSHSTTLGTLELKVYGDTGFYFSEYLKVGKFIINENGLPKIFSGAEFGEKFRVGLTYNEINDFLTNKEATISSGGNPSSKYIVGAYETSENGWDHPVGGLLDMSEPLSDYLGSYTLFKDAIMSREDFYEEEIAAMDEIETDYMRYDVALSYRITVDFDEDLFLDFLDANTSIEVKYLNRNGVRTFQSLAIVNPKVEGTFRPGDCVIKNGNGRLMHAVAMYNKFGH